MTYGMTGRPDKGNTPRTYLPREGDTPTAQLLHRIYPLTEPVSPILPRDPPREDDVVGPILRDPNIDQGLLGAAISQLPPHLSSRFVPQRSALLSHWPGSAENPHQVLPQSQASAPPPETPTPKMNHKLVEEGDRLREEFDRLKKDLDAQYKVKLACQKKNLEDNMSRKHRTHLPSSDRTWTTLRLVDNRLVDTETL